MARRRRGVDWSWARYEIGRAAEVPPRPEPPQPDRTLTDQTGEIVFWRPYWPWWLLMPAGLIIAGRMWRDRMRVAWNADTVVVERILDGSVRRIVRAEVSAVRRDAETIALVLASGDAVPLVIARTVRRADVARALALASALRVTHVGDSGARAPLPSARVRP